MYKRVPLVIALAALLGATLPAQATSAPPVPIQAPRSVQVMAWEGTYAGELRCADCLGIHIEVELRPDRSYVVRELYRGKRKAPIVSRGKFRFDDQAPDVIVLRTQGGGSLAFRLRDNALELREHGTHASLGDDPRYLFTRQAPR
ncbi:copper resistance protein NlpE [Ottowia sp. GY511]|uniref:Copper resistance protein NlpE N-terminal domain-containing protein n=1 Tax=Ottowia flava TaxID=2675430 RepID=A0ABW4L1U8_9BURK|nr:copper resistance protein NlpE [Ottowia sp. GY511]TXK27324.1 copper resistance protein NlpE [Ottowia sp. GY511]